jgi:hypothetical protein
MQIMLYPSFNLGENSVTSPLFTPCIPVLMHVNREARDVTVTIYEKIEQAFHAADCHERKCPLFINFELDILCSLSTIQRLLSYMEFTFSQDIARRLRHVILSATFVENIQRGTDNSLGSDLESGECVSVSSEV